MKIAALYPIYFKNYGIAHACYNLIRHMQSDTITSRLYGLASDGSFKDSCYQDLIPSWTKSIAFRLFSDECLQKKGECLFRQRLTAGKFGEIAYLWPGVSLETYQAAKRSGLTIIYEGVNTHEVNSKSILDAAYSNLGISVAHEITNEKIALESEKLKLADYVFSCSPIMTDAFLKNGIPVGKILQTSYGLSSSSIAKSNYKTTDQLVFTFVGSIGVRKGVHLLLDYWQKAGLNAKLRLVGKVDDAFKPIIEPCLKRQDIEHIPFTNDLATIYHNTDVFILPSIEEGSPLVTYLALGAGLPIIASPMGAGGVLTHNLNGLVIPPEDRDAWIEAMHKLADDADLRGSLASEAFKLSYEYTWQNVAQQRLSQIQNAINQKVNAELKS